MDYCWKGKGKEGGYSYGHGYTSRLMEIELSMRAVPTTASWLKLAAAASAVLGVGLME